MPTGYFYILTNVHNKVLYAGATTDLYKRVMEHRNKIFTNSFTSRYNVNKLVYYESFSRAEDAFEREKQIKGGSRKKKVDLVNKVNPEWRDLIENFKKGELNELIRIKKYFR